MPRVKPGRLLLPPLPEEAKKKFEAAYAALQGGSVERADALCREAHDADPNEPDHIALAVWLGVLRTVDPSPDTLRQAIDALTRVIERNDHTEHAHFYRGQLHKRLGNTVHAARDFRRVVEINPARHDAMSELRLYVMRRRKA